MKKIAYIKISKDEAVAYADTTGKRICSSKSISQTRSLAESNGYIVADIFTDVIYSTLP